MSPNVVTREPQARAPQSDRPFLSDVKTLRQRARQAIEEGAVTPGYEADAQQVCKVLNEALATELVCVLRYKRHYFMADGINAGPVADEFLQHANEEMGHVDQIALRITQLQGEPNFNPVGITDRSHAEYVEGTTLVDMIREGQSLELLELFSALETKADMILTFLALLELVRLKRVKVYQRGLFGAIRVFRPVGPEAGAPRPA